MSYRLNNQRDREKSKNIVSNPVDESCYNRKPRFSFEYLNGRYCISECQQGQKAEVIDSIYRISKLTWREIYQAGKKGCGYEQFSRKEMLCKIPTADIFTNIEKVTVFHRKDKIPIVGFKIDDTLYIFCVDRDHTAYKH